jgi:competence protein ComEA
MFKKLIAALCMLVAAQFAVHPSFAAVEVNAADKAALSGVKDIGPKVADAIITERTKNGKFKNWEDLISRVRGVGPKNSDKMSAAGLTVDGAAKPAMAKKADATAKPADKPMADKGEDAKPATAAKDAKDGKPAADAGKDMKKDEPKK